MSTTKPKKAQTGMAQLNATVPSDLKKAIQKLAVDREISMSDLVAQILQSYIQAEKHKDGKRAA